MKFSWLGMAVVSALLLGACGDDDSTPTKDAGMDAGDQGGGSGTGAPKKDAAVAPVTIKCGANPACGVPDLTGFDAGAAAAGGLDPSLIGQFVMSNPCCAGEAEDKCGVSAELITGGECVELDQAGKADEACPAYVNNIEFSGIKVPINLPSCCRPDNKCGLRVDAIGVGCVERSAFAKFAAMGAMAGAGMMLDAGNFDAGARIESISCAYAPADDGGADDAGN